jgi:sugar/nucleoside kinase (ribokinase family)
MTHPSSPIVDLADARFDYITIGHVTRDEIECSPGGPVAQPGGGAFYSALQAARLGLRTLIVTQGAPGEIEELLAPYRDELDVHAIPADRTTTLSTRGSGATRSQRVLAWAGAILKPIEVNTAILHLAPIARETPISWRGGADFVGITPQGLIRRWEEHHSVPLVQLDAASLLGDTPTVPFDRDPLQGDVSSIDLDPALLPERFDAAVISEQECHSAHALFAAAQRHGADVAVTAGSRPTTVHLHPPGIGQQVVQTAIPRVSTVRDDLGAGDVFAAAFFIALAAGRSPLDAATFGNAAATVRIAGVGPGAIGQRETIEALTHASETGEQM